MTGGLSYCLYIVAAMALHTAVSSMAVYPDISNLTDITKSRQFRQNMEVSKYKNNAQWLENYKYKQPKQLNTKKHPFWESSVVSEEKSNHAQQKDVEEWEEMMRKVTDERLKKWSKYNSKETVDEEKIDGDIENTLEVHQHETESPYSISKNFVDIDSTHTSITPTEHSKYAQPSMKLSNAQLSEKSSMFDRFTNNGIVNTQTYQPNRWGMGVSEPPNKFLKEVSINDQYNFAKNQEIYGENPPNNYHSESNINNDVSSRVLSDIANDELTQQNNLQSRKSHKSNRKKLRKARIKNTTTKLPIVSPINVVSEPLENTELLTEPLRLNEKIWNHDNAINKMEIGAAENTSRVFAPIFVLGPTFWISKLPKSIKEKLKIHRPINLQNGIQSAITINDDHMPSNKTFRTDDADYSGAYEFH